ncbi:hypothetical protein AUP68_09388 [Ilyonectria robusta]
MHSNLLPTDQQNGGHLENAGITPAPQRPVLKLSDKISFVAILVMQLSYIAIIIMIAMKWKGYRKPAASVGSMNTAGMASIIVLMDGPVALEENIS